MPIEEVSKLEPESQITLYAIQINHAQKTLYPSEAEGPTPGGANQVAETTRRIEGLKKEATVQIMRAMNVDEKEAQRRLKSQTIHFSSLF